MQRVLGLKSMDGVLDGRYVNAKHINHNVSSVNLTGIVILKNKAGNYQGLIYKPCVYKYISVLTVW